MNKVHIFLTATVIIAALGCGVGKKADADGVYVGQLVSEFTSIFKRKYEVEKAIIFLDGENYDGYSVFKKDEELFFVHTRYDNPDIISAVRIVSPHFKTEKGIGVGSTFAELQSKYETSGYAVVDGIYVKGFSARFELCKTEIPILPDSHLVKEIVLIHDDIMVTTDKRIVARNAEEAAPETATAAMPETIELEMLELRGDVYYFNDAPFSGTVTKQGEPKIETWEMKYGKFHGEYSERFADYSVVGNYKDGKKHGEWRYTLNQPWVSDGESAEVLYKIETYENDILINEWVLADALPADIEDLIIAIIKAFQNHDEAALNQLLYSNFGIVFYTMPGTMNNIFLSEKISFTDPPPGYTRIPTDIIITEYKIRYEELPEFDCESGWSKPAGIYCYPSDATETRRIANLMTEWMDYLWEAHETRIIDELETKSHHTITVVSAEPDERMDIGISLEFTITLIDDKHYLTIVDIRGYCGA